MHMHSLVGTFRPAMSRIPDLRGDAHAGMDQKRRVYLESPFRKRLTECFG
jgi:hypothetical protein